MATFVAIVLGIASGVAGFIPLLLAKRLSRHPKASIREYWLQIGLGCVIGSLLLLLVALILVSQFATEQFAFYGVSLVAGFLVSSTVYAVWVIRGGRQ